MKSISKKIYLLIVLAVMSFCAVLFPMSANTAKAEVEFDLAVTHAQVKVQKIADSEAEEWAIMFKSTISAEQLAAAEGTEVKFGMLIGPTTRVGDNATHADYVADGFKTFSHVNSANINLEEGATGFDYWAGIKYNDEHLNTADNRLAAAKLSLTAIPFYQVGEEIVLGTSGACQPRNILTESYVYELENEIEDSIPVTAVNNYAGQFQDASENAPEIYICKSTDRLMGAQEVGGDLGELPLTIDETDELYANGVKYESVEALLTSDLEVNGSTSVICYMDGYVRYFKALNAERVITRYAASGTEGELEDYFVYTDATDSITKNIFYLESGKELLVYDGAGTASNKYCFNVEFDGLYVLANDITATSSFNSRQNAGYGLKYNDNTGDYTYKAGFVGTFDGRGNNIDMTTSYSASMSFFPALNMATIKNIGFLNAYAGAPRGMYGAPFLTTDLYNTTLENVYIQFRGVGNFPNTFRYAHLAEMIRGNNVYNNVIIDSDIISQYYDAEAAEYSYYTSAIKSQYDSFFTITKDEETGITTSTPASDISSNNVAKMNFMNGLFYQNGYTCPGMTASNLFAVGSTPLHIFSTNSEAQLQGTAVAAFVPEVYITVSKMPKYNAGTDEEGNIIWENATTYVNSATMWYTLDQFAGSEDEEWLKEIYAYAKDYLLCSQGGHAEAAFANGAVVKLCFSNRAGAYDMRNADQFANWIKDEANAEKVAKFDSAYWVVDAENGTITWKGLTA